MEAAISARKSFLTADVKIFLDADPVVPRATATRATENPREPAKAMAAELRERDHPRIELEPSLRWWRRRSRRDRFTG